MIDFSSVTQLTVNGQAVINLFLNGTKIWEKGSGDEYFWLRNIGGSAQDCRLSGVGSSLEYSVNGSSWQTYSENADVSVPANGKIKFRNNGTAFPGGPVKVVNRPGLWNVGGDIMTLVTADTEGAVMGGAYFASMFANTGWPDETPGVGIVDASELKLTCSAIPANGCNGMFWRSTSLTAGPQLCATSTGNYAYSVAFGGCSSLVKAPRIPNSSGGTYPYNAIFDACTNLSTVSVDFTSWTGKPSWLDGASPYGELWCPAALGNQDTIQRGSGKCPYGWNVRNWGEVPPVPLPPVERALSDSLHRRWTFDTLSDDVADVPLTLYGNAQLSDGSLVIDGNGSIQTNYAQMSGNNWPTTSADGGVTIEMWAEPFAHRNWVRFFEFGQQNDNNQVAYARYGDGDAMDLEMQGSVYGNSYTRCYTPTLSTGTLYHIVCVFDWRRGNGTQVSAFQFLPDGSYTMNWANLSANLSGFWGGNYAQFLGRTGNPSWRDPDFTGRYADFRIWSKPLTLDEIVSCDTLGPDELPWKPNPLTFKSSEPLTVSLGYSGEYGDAPTLNLEYDVDGSDEWTSLGYSDPITAQGGQEIRIRASSPNVGGTANDSAYNYFQLTGEGVSAYGDLRSLLNKNKFANGRFDYLFYHQSALKDASDLVLPNKSAYRQAKGLFFQCGSLEKAPALPATTLCAECYRQMFYQCSSLTAAPSITADAIGESGCRDMFGQSGILSAGTVCATTLDVDACRGMFWHCDSLTAAPEICATTLSTGSCWGMFLECGSLETPPPVLAATSAAPSCYAQMFDRCSSLTAAPALCATVPAGDAYKQMFLSCYSLTSIPELHLTGTFSGTFCQMFEGCSSIIDASQITLPVEDIAAQYAYSGMFSQCYSLVSGPHIRAKNGATKAFAYMFDGCSALTSITVDFTSWPVGTNANQNWVRQVYGEGVFTCPTSLGTNDTITRNNSKAPYNMTVINSDQA